MTCPTEYGQWLFLFFLTFIYTGKIDYMGPHSDADNFGPMAWNPRMLYSRKGNVYRTAFTYITLV